VGSPADHYTAQGIFGVTVYFVIYLLYCAVFSLLCDIISGLHSNYTDKQVKSSMHVCVCTCTLTFIQTWLVLSVCPNCVLESFPKQHKNTKFTCFTTEHL